MDFVRGVRFENEVKANDDKEEEKKHNFYSRTNWGCYRKKNIKEKTLWMHRMCYQMFL